MTTVLFIYGWHSEFTHLQGFNNQLDPPSNLIAPFFDSIWGVIPILNNADSGDYTKLQQKNDNNSPAILAMFSCRSTCLVAPSEKETMLFQVFRDNKWFVDLWVN